jgi:hypothetical protein
MIKCSMVENGTPKNRNIECRLCHSRLNYVKWHTPGLSESAIFPNALNACDPETSVLESPKAPILFLKSQFVTPMARTKHLVSCDAETEKNHLSK